MSYKSLLRFRKYTCFQLTILGLFQVLLSLALVRKRQETFYPLISGLTGAANFGISIVLLGCYAVHVYDSGKRKVRIVFALGILVNLVALSIVLKLANEKANLTNILLLMGDDATDIAFAVFFYVSSYLACLLAVSLATFFQIVPCRETINKQQETSYLDNYPVMIMSKNAWRVRPPLEVRTGNCYLDGEPKNPRVDLVPIGTRQPFPNRMEASQAPDSHDRTAKASSGIIADHLKAYHLTKGNKPARSTSRISLGDNAENSRIRSHSVREHVDTDSVSSCAIEIGNSNPIAPPRPPPPPPPPPPSSHLGAKARNNVLQMNNLRQEISDIHNNHRNLVERTPHYAKKTGS